MAGSSSKKRGNSPVPSQIEIDAELNVNDRHPLAGLDAERRNAGRIETIASVLARLALSNSDREKEVAS